MANDTPLFLQAGSHSAREARLLPELLFTEGVYDGNTDLKVTQRGAGANMSVDVAAGIGFVTGDDEADQGRYLIRSTAVTNVLVPQAVTNPRIDRIVARVRDSVASGGAFDDFVIERVAGTEAATPLVPDLPDSSLALATIAVAVSDTQIIDAQITDVRVQSNAAEIKIGVQFEPMTNAARLALAGADLFDGRAVKESDTVDAFLRSATGAAWRRFLMHEVATAKGDILAASGAGALARLGVGANDFALVADSAQSLGVKWAEVSRLKTLHTVPTDVDIVNTASESNAFSYSVPGNTMGANGGGMLLVMGGDYLNNSGGNSDLTLKVTYGATTLISNAAIAEGPSAIRKKWMLALLLQNRDATNAQALSALWLMSRAGSESWEQITSFSAGGNNYIRIGSGTAAEDSTAAKTLAFKVTHGNADASISFRTRAAHLIALPAR